MSCYVCEDNHFNYLVQAAREYKARVRMAGDYMPPEDLYHDDFAAAVARMLKRENLRSYCHRYPDETMPEMEAITTRYTDPARIFDPVQVLKSCMCYSYQSCEHPGWPQSDAYATIQALISAACDKLPGFSAALWGAPEPDRNLLRLLPRR